MNGSPYHDLYDTPEGGAPGTQEPGKPHQSSHRHRSQRTAPATPPATPQGVAGRSRLKLTSLSSLEPQGFEPLVKGFLFKDSRAAVYGGPSGAKGLLALDVAMCVPTGRAWHSCDVAQGRVLYIDGTAGGSLAARARAWELANHRGNDEICFLLPPDPITLDQYDELVDLASQVSPVLVVLNVTLWTVPNADETAALAISRRLREATGACVLLVWHASVDQGWEPSHVLAAVDTTIEVERQGLTVTVANPKAEERPGAQGNFAQARRLWRFRRPVRLGVVRAWPGAPQLGARGRLRRTFSDVP